MVQGGQRGSGPQICGGSSGQAHSPPAESLGVSTGRLSGGWVTGWYWGGIMSWGNLWEPLTASAGAEAQNVKVGGRSRLGGGNVS